MRYIEISIWRRSLSAKGLTAFAFLLTITANPALACREMVVYPDHLDLNSSGDVSLFYVVDVVEHSELGFSGRLVRSFGDVDLIGQAVEFLYRTNEEPHAVCPNLIVAGKRYLILAEHESGRFTTSRFNWFNVSSDHPNFAGYISDLAKASSH